jgi:hypothetical protein
MRLKRGCPFATRLHQVAASGPLNIRLKRVCGELDLLPDVRHPLVRRGPWSTRQKFTPKSEPVSTLFCIVFVRSTAQAS